jgi:hypothetical protein
LLNKFYQCFQAGREENMPRLTAKQWEQARAEYEVRGIGLRETSRAFGVSVAAVSKKAKAEG